jgi:hypothetical protein
MKRIWSITAAILLTLSLTSCGQKVSYQTSDYIINLNTYHAGFKILQLTDIHLNVASDWSSESNYLDILIKRADPDMIVITGDSFLVSNKTNVDELYGKLDEEKIPWTIVWGNHDKQGSYNPDYPIKKAEESKYSYFKNLDDNIYGDSNFIINLNNSFGETEWQLYCLDSNSYYSAGQGLDYEYDIVHADQVSWYKDSVNASTASAGRVIPSLMFFHIPLLEYQIAWESLPASEQIGSYQEGNKKQIIPSNGEVATYNEGEKDEKSCPGYKNSGLFETAKSLNSTKGMFCGHDHSNDFSVTYEGISLSYGRKFSIGCYYDKSGVLTEGKPLTGGKLITLKNGGSFDESVIQLSYGETN